MTQYYTVFTISQLQVKVSALFQVPNSINSAIWNANILLLNFETCNLEITAYFMYHPKFLPNGTIPICGTHEFEDFFEVSAIGNTYV